MKLCAVFLAGGFIIPRHQKPKYVNPLSGMNFSPKWQQRQLRQLEMLQSEGYSNDSNTKKQTDSQMQQTQFPAKENNPQNVSNKASDTEATYLHISAKGS